MAKFEKGEYITAEKLNQLNSEKGEITSGYIKNESKSLGPYYLRGNCYIGAYFGGFWSAGQIFPVNYDYEYELFKMENGTWVKKDGDHQAGSAITAFSPGGLDHKHEISELGEGWYRISGRVSLGGTNFNDGGINLYVKPWVTNNVKGDYLMYFDSPDNSGNPIGKGTYLTADILNSGRVLTVPAIR